MSASCTPPSVTYNCSGTVSSGLQATITVLEQQLPILINALKYQGQLAVSAAGTLISTGQAEFSSIGSLSGQAFACGAAALQASVSASASVNVSVMASASVSGSAGAM
jgi:hypothetical protein